MTVAVDVKGRPVIPRRAAAAASPSCIRDAARICAETNTETPVGHSVRRFLGRIQMHAPGSEHRLGLPRALRHSTAEWLRVQK